jgi:hypothetical protein
MRELGYVSKTGNPHFVVYSKRNVVVVAARVHRTPIAFEIVTH